MIEQKFVVLAVAAAIFMTIIRLRRSLTVKNIQGPPTPSLLLGHENVLQNQLETEGLQTTWFETYGEVFRTRGVFGTHVLQVADPKALQYILQTSGYHFPKPYDTRQVLTRAFGAGLIAATGTTHQRQRKVINPAFSTQQLRTFLSIFQSITHRLAQKWETEIKTSPVVNVYAGFGVAALDIIGKTGFDYDFNAVAGESTELETHMRNLFIDLTFPSRFKQIYDALWRHLPVPALNVLDRFSTKEKVRFNRYHGMSKRIVKESLEQKKRDGVDKDAKDMLSVLARSNNSETDKLRISEAEVLSQAATFLLAGHDTTATTLAWLFYEFCKHPDQQARVRAEIVEARSRLADDEEFTPQAYDSMPYLNACIKEVLRFHPILPELIRSAGRDDVIPLMLPITDLNGQVINSIPVRKGQTLVIRIARYNRVKAVWGDDADQWNPERFMEAAHMKKDAPLGVFSNLLTFSAGLQACVGWRFALIELQTVTTEIVSKFELSLPDKDQEVLRLNAGLMKPALRQELHKGPQLPMKLRRLDV